MTVQGNDVPIDTSMPGIEPITDTSLARLDADALLADVLRRTKDMVRADTAAVLLLDASERQLTATAAVGLEEEVRQGTRVPFGRGFAGRIAAQRKPVVLDHVGPGSVVNPILMAKGIQAMMGVPLLAGGRLLGVLHVGSLRPRKFTENEVAALQLAAERVAEAVQAVMALTDRAAAAALQRSLVPSALPDVPGVEMAARYVPGHGVVGGDWYDVFTLPAGEMAVVMGDVAGSGLPAAVIMGRMRSALRAYALESPDPAEVLAKLDAKMQHFEPGALATILYAVFDLAVNQVRICSAGHLPPIIAQPGQPAALTDLTPGLMIGVSVEAPRDVRTLAFPPGALFCFFTDGLVERRGTSLDDALARLCQEVVAGPPESACADVMWSMVGKEEANDDIALLMVRRLPDG